MASNAHGILQILNFIGKLIDYRILYTNIKNDPDIRPHSKFFGARALIYSILFALLSLGGAALTILGFTKNLGVILNIFVIILGIAFMLYSVGCFILALSATLKQIKLNRRAISWIALVIFILAIAAVAFGIFVIMKNFN